MLTNRLVTELSRVLTEFPQISLVYLFGSQVSGDTGPMSDIDIAILCDYGSPEVAIQTTFTHALSVAIKSYNIDVLLLRNAPIELAYRIIEEGELLFQRDVETRVEYEAMILSRYFDYLPILRAQREQILQGDAHGRRIQRYREAFRRIERTLGKTGTDAGKASR